MTDQQELLTIDQQAERLKVKKSWLYAQTRQKGPDSIPVLRVGKYLRFRSTEVETWLRERQERGLE